MTFPSDFHTPEHLIIVGLGLIGGSLAMAASQAHPNLTCHAVDPDEAALQTALAQGVVQHVHRQLPDTLPQRSLVILCAPPATNLALLAELAPRIHGWPVWVSDVGGCKRAIVALGAERLPGQFLGGHPMAGRERGGLGSATALLFAGRPWLLCPPTPESAPPWMPQFQAWLTALGARPSVVLPDEHDVAMAWVSHGPQWLSTVYAAALAEQRPSQRIPLAGGGLADVLRLSGSPVGLWAQIFLENAEALDGVLGTLIDRLTATRQALAQARGGDSSGLQTQLQRDFDQANRVYALLQQLRQTG